MNIKVVGIGGMGINFVNFLIASRMEKVEYITVDTDRLSLDLSHAEKKIFLDAGIRECGREEAERAAFRCENQFQELLMGTDLLFVAAGIGGAAGSGITPVILETAKKSKIFTVSIAVRPFYLEGFETMKIANTGIKKIEKITDSLIVVLNEKLYNHSDSKESIVEAYNRANGIIKQGIESIIKIMMETGFMNINFADIKTVLSHSVNATICLGEAEGTNAADKIIEQLRGNSLFEGKLENAKKILINFIVDQNVSLIDIGKIAERISEIVIDKNVSLVWGVSINQNYEEGGKIKAVVIASI